MTGVLRHLALIDQSDEDLLHSRVALMRAHPEARVHVFGCSQDALDWMLQPDAPELDLILLGFQLSGMDGQQFLEAYARLHVSQRAQAIVVMLDRSTSSSDRQRLQGHACVRHYVVKPIDAAQASMLNQIVA